jgi:hypothetical protein
MRAPHELSGLVLFASCLPAPHEALNTPRTERRGRPGMQPERLWLLPRSPFRACPTLCDLANRFRPHLDRFGTGKRGDGHRKCAPVHALMVT